MRWNLHWVGSPEDEGESANGLEELAGLGIFGHGHRTSMDGKLVDDDEERETTHGVVCPFHTLVRSKGSKHTGQDHDDIGHDGDENVGTTQAGEEAKIQEQKRGGDAPVDVSGPVNGTLDGLVGVGYMLVGFLDHDLDGADAVTGCHGEVRDGGESGDEGRQDVEETFLLRTS